MLRVLASSIIFFSLAFSSYAGVIFHIDQMQYNPKGLSKSTFKVKDNKLRIDFYENGDENSSMIYRSDRKEMITIDHENKSYMVIDKETMDKLAKRMQEAMAQYEQAMKNVPEEYRKMMEEKFKKQMPGMSGSSYVEPVLKKAGSDKVNGYVCTKYDVYKGAEKVRQHCVTDWGNIEGGDEIKTIMLEMADFMDQMTRSFANSSGSIGSGIQFERNALEQLRKLDGFPVQTFEYYNGALESESTLESSKKASLDPADFEPPAGYKKESMNMR